MSIPVRLLSHWRGFFPTELRDADRHLARYERSQPVSTTFDIEVLDAGEERWRKTAFTGLTSVEEAGRNLDWYLEFSKRLNPCRLRVVKVITHLEFEHMEFTNG